MSAGELLSRPGIQEEWNELAAAADNVFATWEWSSVWWRHFGGGRPKLVTVCRDDRQKAYGVVPLYLWAARPLRVARLIGHGPADQLGPICADSDRPQVARALRETLADSGCDAFVGETLDAREGWSTRLGAPVYARGANPALNVEWPTWEGFLSSRSSNFRGQVRRRERALEKLGSRFRLCEDLDDLDRDLDALFALHRGRWSEGRSNFVRLEAFHRDFARLACERGWLRLWFLEIRGEPVAAWYGLRFNGIDWYYQAGRDPAWDRHAVGFVLLAHSLREAIADGVRQYRFGRGGQHYKTRFGPEDAGLETIVLSCGPRARAAVAAVQVARTGKRTLTRALRATPVGRHKHRNAAIRR